MTKTIKVKNISDKRVGVVGFGDIKPNQIVDMPKEAWKKIHQSWPKSRPYRCEMRDSLIEVTKKGKPKKRRKSKKKLKAVEKKVEAKPRRVLGKAWSTKSLRNK